MTEMSPLRRRMIEDMAVRNLSPATQRSYVHAVAKFGRSPEKLGLEEVRAFQVHLVAGGMSWPASEPDGLRASFSVWCHAQAGRSAGADSVCPYAAQTAGGVGCGLIEIVQNEKPSLVAVHTRLRNAARQSRSGIAWVPPLIFHLVTYNWMLGSAPLVRSGISSSIPLSHFSSTLQQTPGVAGITLNNAVPKLVLSVRENAALKDSGEPL